eukprot:3502190-Prymnesium_polylepis.2
MHHEPPRHFSRDLDCTVGGWSMDGACTAWAGRATPCGSVKMRKADGTDRWFTVGPAAPLPPASPSTGCALRRRRRRPPRRVRHRAAKCRSGRARRRRTLPGWPQWLAAKGGAHSASAGRDRAAAGATRRATRSDHRREWGKNVGGASPRPNRRPRRRPHPDR